MRQVSPTTVKVLKAVQKGKQLPLATKNYPSRGQTAVQELYQTDLGKFFLKRSSDRNHRDCRISVENGSLAEREYWAYRLAERIGVPVPPLWLADSMTTVQVWLDYPDARQYATSQGKMSIKAVNIFDCALFDWVTGQIDRHDANYLYNYVQEEIILIDSAHSFLKYSGSIPDYLRYFEAAHHREVRQRVDSAVKRELGKLNQKELSRLVPLRDEEERSGLLSRIEDIHRISNIEGVIQLYRGKKK